MDYGIGKGYIDLPAKTVKLDLNFPSSLNTRITYLHFGKIIYFKKKFITFNFLNHGPETFLHSLSRDHFIFRMQKPTF
jgi:hypothetical protein